MIVGLYEKYKEQLNSVYKTFEKMKQIEISPDLKESITRRLFDIEFNEEKLSTKKQNQLDKFNASYIEETSVLGNNLWGMFNAGTHYSTHKIKETKNSYGNLLGSAATFNEKLYNTVLEYV
jgi:hypothetical protein